MALLLLVIIQAATAQNTIWQLLVDDPQFTLSTNISARYPELVSILNSTEVLYTIFASPAITVDTLGQFNNPEVIKTWQDFLFKGTPPFNLSVRRPSTSTVPATSSFNCHLAQVTKAVLESPAFYAMILYMLVPGLHNAGQLVDQPVSTALSAAVDKPYKLIVDNYDDGSVCT